MDDPITFDSIDVSLSASLRPVHPGKPLADQPFRILIMGDFSGRSNRGCATDGADIGKRRLWRVDRDNADAVMDAIRPILRIPVGGGAAPLARLTFGELDDFHPDQIYHRLDVFGALRKERRDLLDPDTFLRTAARLANSDTMDEKRGDGTVARRVDDTASEGDGLLDRILDGDAASGEERSLASDLDRFLKDLVAPYLLPDTRGEQDALVNGVDRAIAGMMKTILHHVDFQQLEGNWRALDFLLRRLSGDAPVQIDLYDCSRAELCADLTGHEELTSTAIYKKLAAAGAQPAGEVPWALLIGLYTFDKTRFDAVALARAGALGEMLGAPFIAGAGGSVIGTGALAEAPDPADWIQAASAADETAWQVLRTLPEAGWIGLCLPRFMIRLPYGSATDPLDGFDFEEMPSGANHEHYLWAHPAWAVAMVCGQTFARHGWNFNEGLENAIDGLPLHLTEMNGAPANMPCAEVLLSDQAIETIVRHGVMPLVSWRDRDRVVLARLQSFLDPPTSLTGHWNP